MGFLAVIQESGLGIWLRESSWGLFACLIVHTAGMGLIVGAAATTSLRVLGLLKAIPLSAMGQALSVLPPVAVAVVISGVLLVVAYPAKALTNPLFWIKILLVAVAAQLTVTLYRRLAEAGASQTPPGARVMAAACLVLWPAGLVAGKFIEYTYRTLLV